MAAIAALSGIGAMLEGGTAAIGAALESEGLAGDAIGVTDSAGGVAADAPALADDTINPGDLTTHGSERAVQRGISSDDINAAIDSAKQSGNVVTQVGKYGTQQNVYNGSNGVTVVIETEGRNAGKVITTWHQ